MARLAALCVAFLSALPLGALAAGHGPRVVVLKSADRAAYASVVAGFSAEVKGEVQELTLDESGDAQRANARLLEKLSQDRPAMVLAVGPTAANAAKRALPQVPIVFCMVPYYEKYALEGPNITGIAMTSDFSVELSLLEALGPQYRRIGILHDPRYSAERIDEARKQARDRAMTIVPLEADTAEKAERVLVNAADKVDALVMVADKTVATESVVRELIAVSQKSKAPLVAISPTEVQEGALLSIAPTPTGIGQQAGRLANRLIHEKVDAGALAVARPEIVEVSLNLSTAKKLGNISDLAQELFKLSAARGYPIKVYP